MNANGRLVKPKGNNKVKRINTWSKIKKHLLSTEGSTKGIPTWFLYLVIGCGIYALITNINW